MYLEDSTCWLSGERSLPFGLLVILATCKALSFSLRKHVYVICTDFKAENDNFLVKKEDIFLSFFSKYRLWVHVSKAVQTSTHNQCFKLRIRKPVYSCKPQFYYIEKWDAKGYGFETHSRDIFRVFAY